MGTVVVRYTTQAEHADENQRRVVAVFAELAAKQPAGLRYTTYRLADGTFVHIAEVDGDTNPLTEIAAFGEFVGGVEARCEPGQGPNPQPATVIGAYVSPAVTTDT